MWLAIVRRVAPVALVVPLALIVFPAVARAQRGASARGTVVTAPKALPLVAPAAPTTAPASLNQSFVLGTGERTGFGLVVGKPGPIVVNVRWTGAPLLISLVKPGGISVDQQGSGSVTLQYAATAEDVKKGMLWSVNVRPAQLAPTSARSAALGVIERPIKLVVENVATGTVSVQYPPGDANLAQAELSAKANQALATKPTSQQLSVTVASALAVSKAALATAEKARQTTILEALKSKVTVQSFQQMSARIAVGEKASAGVLPVRTAAKATGSSQQAQVTSVGSNQPATVALDPVVGSLSAPAGQPGDPILISGSGFSDVPGEAHFIVANGKDLVAPVSAWNDTQIFAAIPDASGLQAYSGQMYVKRGTSSSRLVPFQFNPAMEIRTLGITVDRSTAGATVAGGEVLHPESVGDIGNLLFGHRGDDQFFMSTLLKNGWTVKSAYLMGFGGSGIFRYGGADAYVVESRQGTNSPYVKVHWWIDASAMVGFFLYVDIIGPKGVPHL